MSRAPAPSLDVASVRGEVKILGVILEVVLVEEVSQLLARGKLDSTGAVDVDIPAAGLLAMFALLEFPDPAVGQSGVRELEDLGQVGWPSAYLDIAVGGAQGDLTASGQGERPAWY